MELIVELIIGFVAEIVLTIFGEALVELGLHSVTEGTGGKRWKGFFFALLYAIAAFIAGYLSLIVMPLVVFGNQAAGVIYAIVAPVIAGFGLCFVSWIIDRGINDRGFFQIKKFAYGVLFALVFTISRSLHG